MVNVKVKWGKQMYTVDVNTAEPPLVFKSQLFALTGVPPDRQKVSGFKGGMLKDDADWNALGVREGQTIMMIGTADVIKAPEKATIFMEDLPEDALQELAHAGYPPGIENLGNTCYMNATLQCFRAVPELRAALKSYTGHSTTADNAASVTAALRDLYNQMELSNKAAHPLLFLMILRRAFPQFAQQGQGGTFMQQDAEECWSQLLTTLSRKVPQVPGIEAPPATADPSASSSSSSSSGAIGDNKSAIADLFMGTMESSLKCLEAEETPSTKTDTFVKLTCHISPTTTFLLPGLKEALEEPLTKKNESLGREAKYVRSSRISRLPYYLTVQFMRFEWRADSKMKAKIVKPIEFPFILDVYDLCTPDLQKSFLPKRKAIEEAEEKKLQSERERMKRKAAEQDGTPAEPAQQDKAPAPAEAPKPANPDRPLSLVNDSGKYELIAVLTHKGRSADSGHYIAWVKQEDDKWLKFDDEKVSMVNNDEIQKLNGKGGADWNIAYLCLYRTYNPPL